MVFDSIRVVCQLTMHVDLIKRLQSLTLRHDVSLQLLDNKIVRWLSQLAYRVLGLAALATLHFLCGLLFPSCFVNYAVGAFAENAVNCVFVPSVGLPCFCDTVRR